jgi:hypothetical protein
MLAIAYADKAADVLGGSDVELQVRAPHGLFMPRSAHQTLDAELVPAPPRARAVRPLGWARPQLRHQERQKRATTPSAGNA